VVQHRTEIAGNYSCIIRNAALTGRSRNEIQPSRQEIRHGSQRTSIRSEVCNQNRDGDVAPDIYWRWQYRTCDSEIGSIASTAATNKIRCGNAECPPLR